MVRIDSETIALAKERHQHLRMLIRIACGIVIGGMMACAFILAMTTPGN